MAMTREEKATKNYIFQKLREEGYPTYANIFAKLDLHLTANSSVVGYMEPKNGAITINRNLEEDQFSVIIRHEILHHYLRHEKRLLDHLAEKRGINPDDLDDLSLRELKDYLYGNDTFNIAADYEISNRGYTEEDKQTEGKCDICGADTSGESEDQKKDVVVIPPIPTAPGKKPSVLKKLEIMKGVAAGNVVYQGMKNVQHLQREAL